MKKIKNNISIFSATNSMKVLSYLVENPGKEFLGSEIQKATSLSRAGIYIALHELIKQKMVSKTRRGKFLFYSLFYDEPVIKQFKVLKNILLLQAIVTKLKPLSKKIILYGSTSRGEDMADSDIDLFILSADPPKTKKLLSTIKKKRNIQAVIKSPTEFSDFKEEEKIFYEEMNRGITLWEEKR